MTVVDLWAAAMAIIAGSAIAIRARMLRPHNAAWTHAPAVVWIGLSLLALGLLMASCTIITGAHAAPREAVVYTLLAISSAVMLWNLNRNGRAAEAERKRIAGEVGLVMELSGPAARYDGERP